MTSLRRLRVVTSNPLAMLMTGTPAGRAGLWDDLGHDLAHGLAGHDHEDDVGVAQGVVQVQGGAQVGRQGDIAQEVGVGAGAVDAVDLAALDAPQDHPFPLVAQMAAEGRAPAAGAQDGGFHLMLLVASGAARSSGCRPSILLLGPVAQAGDVAPVLEDHPAADRGR